MKCGIFFVSMSGNTEDMADMIEAEVKTIDNTVKVEKHEMDEVEAGELTGYDVIFLGSYTWGDGDLPYEAEDFYDELEDVDLSGKVVGVFGSGDRDYPHFCSAVDMLAERAEKQGARTVPSNVKIELAPDTEEDEEQIRALVKDCMKSPVTSK
ncbi:flavodoxin [Alteribacter natronophilus]|uniref:flavodoxin n=1 Tax=Alteribacter natronophilus TaxID=2583810 RepID=UPI00110E6BED|nr:flavodoxin [Alteribacter natronophilus]TMW70927.1 flavodoxin [Alteribacter natronophilus]